MRTYVPKTCPQCKRPDQNLLPPAGLCSLCIANNDVRHHEEKRQPVTTKALWEQVLKDFDEYEERNPCPYSEETENFLRGIVSYIVTKRDECPE